jgi:prefoldin alpha subunit|tara:strand:- start:1996 stop:2511 length:516 start_codon:yes stop_codon:yes gene_type:complete
VTDPKEELQRIARLVEANRERMEALEAQLRRLEAVRMEQVNALKALESIPDTGTKGAMVPLGAGVQIIADIPSDYGAVVDIGSGIQAERTRAEAAEILSTRNNELTDLTERMKTEFDQLEESTMALAGEFNEKMTAIESGDEPEAPVDSPAHDEPKRKSRRRRGTELTLDD